MSFPKDLNYNDTKEKSIESKPYINRYRSNNSSYLNNDVIRIEIKCGKPGEYIFPKNAFLEGSIGISVTNSGTSIGYCYIEQSIYSIFKRLTIKHNNTILEDQTNCNKIWTALLDANYSDSQRRAFGITHMIAEPQVSTGSYNNTGLGAKLVSTSIAANATTDNTSSGKNYFVDFCIPLNSSFLGVLCNKPLPIGEVNGKIVLEIELASPNQCIVAETIADFSPTINKCEVKNIYYNVPAVILPDEVNRILTQSMNNKFIINGISYKSSVDTINTGVYTFTDKFYFDVASTKAFYFFLQNKEAAAGDNVKYRCVSARPRCNLSEYYISIDNETIPTQTITNSSRMFAELMRTFNKNNIGSTYINNGNYNYNNYSTALTALTHATSGDFGVNTSQQRFLAGITLDKFPNSSETLICGTDTINKSIDLFLTFSSVISVQLMIYAFVSYDVIYTISNGEIKVTK